MEVKPGYKRTDIGVIPEDWEVKNLKDCCIKLNVGFVGVCEPYYTTEESGVLLIRTGNLHGDKLDLSEVKLVTEEFHKKNKKSQITTGDILIARHGYSGNAVLVPPSVEDANTLNIVILRTDSSVLLNDYGAYAINSDPVRKQAANKTAGSTQGVINTKEIAILQIIFPPLPEQRAIAAALSDVDSLLSALDALLAKKRLIKQGAMQELLTGKRRLPGFTDEWDGKKIGEITHTTAGGTPSTLIGAYWGGEIKWMSSGELHLKQVYDVEGRITEEGLNNSSTKIIPPKCVLIGLAGQGKTRGTVAMNMVELCTNQSIAAIFPCATLLPEYLYFNLDSRYDELRTISAGDGGRGGLNLTLINKLDVPLPSLAEQTAIAEILSDMDAEIATLEARREKTRLVKQGMMQELLTGRIRLQS
jgi:type I restriction enzyme S subunit